MSKFKRSYSGQRDTSVSEREIKNRAVARRAAAEGIVLLKNEGILPIKHDSKVLVYGKGATGYIKGGTGSGDVNEREVVDISEGLAGNGIEVLNMEDIRRYKAEEEASGKDWGARLLEKLAGDQGGSDMAFFQAVYTTPRTPVEPLVMDDDAIKYADAVIYVISRVAGEGRDRNDAPGDYQLDDAEIGEINKLSALSDKIIVLINAGGQIDTKLIRENGSIKAILNISQGGMEGGNAVADILTGKVTPSGKLTSTWTYDYMDYPTSATFSHNSGDVSEELYTEGIYVGYRYFDSFDKPVVYPFGYGLSYTDFTIGDYAVSASGNKVTLTARVTNIGEKYSGKEVLQVYAVSPQPANADIKSEYKSLVGFAKTPLLTPGSSCEVSVDIDAKSLAYYDETGDMGRWIVSGGDHILLAGNSSDNVRPAAVITVDGDHMIETVKHILPLKKELDEIVRPDEVIEAKRAALNAEIASLKGGLAAVSLDPQQETYSVSPDDEYDTRAKAIADKMSEDELIAMLMGEMTKGQDNIKDGELVPTGIFVPGAAGETSCIFEDKYEIPAISMADGPAGLRLNQNYEVDRETGLIYGTGLLSLFMGKVMPETHHENVDVYHMYATAIPIGTLLAQSFDMDLLEEIGNLVAGEMVEYGITWWLAPGLNIQRNPLCGRNFEYYSEDPLVSGKCAAAITRGVQATSGCGTTIKHFACNNQEDNRDRCDSVVGERALRQIYLKGFEIAIKESQPLCIMTSYNLINGVHTANSADLCTTCARDEWGYNGIIMTDWTTTKEGCSDAYMCAMAGNDLIMPGMPSDVEDMKAAFADGRLTLEAARACAARLIAGILRAKRC